MPFTYDFPRPSATVTMAMFYGSKVLLGLRGRTSAYANYWSLPGGFVDVLATDEKGNVVRPGETVEQAAIRETQEETGIVLSEKQLNLFHVSSKPDTDPRCHVINTCFFINLTQEQYENFKAADDLADLKPVDVYEADRMELAFDHNDILRRAMRASGHVI